MPVALEFINVLVKKQSIASKVRDGWVGFCHAFELSPDDWNDDHLLRIGAMGYEDVEAIVEELESLGLKAYSPSSLGNNKWIDICVFDSTVGAASPCDWLDIEYYKTTPTSMRLKGDESTVVVGEIRDWFGLSNLLGDE